MYGGAGQKLCQQGSPVLVPFIGRSLANNKNTTKIPLSNTPVYTTFGLHLRRLPKLHQIVTGSGKTSKMLLIKMGGGFPVFDVVTVASPGGKSFEFVHRRASRCNCELFHSWALPWALWPRQ